jgi:hypothetical protein
MGRADRSAPNDPEEAKDPGLGSVRDEQAELVQHDGGAPHVHVGETSIPGGYHLGLYVTGRYFPDGTVALDSGHGGHEHPAMVPDADGEAGEPFTRIVTASFRVVSPESSERA